jgi:exodeoxyribonuclease VII small subunit
MPKSKKPTKDKTLKAISFEGKLEKLKEIVEKLERGDVSLKESMENYQTSLDLIKECCGELGDAELKIEKIMRKEGKIISESLED